MDRLAQARAVDWIKRNPTDFLMLLPKKFVRYWEPDGETKLFHQRGYLHYDTYWLLFRAVRGLNQIYYFAILILALPSIWLLLRQSTKLNCWTTLGLWLCAYFTTISLVFSGQSRYHFCLIPFLAIYAAWTLARSPRFLRAVS